MTIERVRKIKSLNVQGVIPEELEIAEITSSKVKEVEPEFVELVGQISLQSLEKADRKRKQKQQQKQKPQHPSQQQRGQQQQRGPQQGPQQNPNRPQANQQRGPRRPPQQPRRDK